MHNRFLPALHRDSKRAMETRSKAAAAAASLIPFSCCCCFDEFNLTDRTPMVLPCGHTYVCGKCTKRLNRCMECREPLFVTGVLLQKTSGNPVSTAPGTQNRGGYSPQPQTPDIHRNLTTAAEKIMLPIPKNLLLMSLMEAAQRQTRVDHAFSKESDEQSTGSSVLDDDEEYNLDKIISGISTLSGPCGTYAVKGDIELAVVPVDPTTQSNDDEKNVDELNVDSTLLLHSGQTVQVVNFQHGVAKLARGTGYIVATSNELVKVAGPRETTCRLEGLLETVENRGNDLAFALDENRQIESCLKQQIQDSLAAEPDYPIIASAYSLDMGQENNSPERNHEDLHTPSGTPIRFDDSGTPGSVETNTGARFVERLVNGPVPIYPHSSELAGLGLGMPSYRRAATDDNQGDGAFACGATFMDSGFSATHYFTATTALLPSPADPDLHHNHSMQSEDPFTHGLPMTSSFDAVDFRTGLSGHRGLTNVKKTGANSTPRANLRMMKMSEHRGIGRITVRPPSPTSSPLPAQRAYD